MTSSLCVSFGGFMLPPFNFPWKSAASVQNFSSGLGNYNHQILDQFFANVCFHGARPPSLLCQTEPQDWACFLQERGESSHTSGGPANQNVAGYKEVTLTLKCK